MEEWIYAESQMFFNGTDELLLFLSYISFVELGVWEVAVDRSGLKKTL